MMLAQLSPSPFHLVEAFSIIFPGLSAAAGPASRHHHGEPEPRPAEAGEERQRDVLLHRHQLRGQRILQSNPARHPM